MKYSISRDKKILRTTESLTEAIEFIANKNLAHSYATLYLDDEVGTIATKGVGHGFKFCNVTLKTDNQDKDEEALEFVKEKKADE